MRIPAEVFQPSGADVGVFEELGLLFLELLDRHLLLADLIGVIFEELLGVGLEDFPRRVGDDRVKAAFDEDPVKLVTPVERLEGLDVFELQGALFRPASGIFLAVPCRLLVPDAEQVAFGEQNVVQGGDGGILAFLNVVAQFLEFVGLAPDGAAIDLDEFVLFLQQLLIALAEKIRRMAPVKVVVVDVHQADERVAGHDVKLDVRQGLQIIGGMRG